MMILSSVLESARFIASQAQHVHINTAAITRAAHSVRYTLYLNNSAICYVRMIIIVGYVTHMYISLVSYPDSRPTHQTRWSAPRYPPQEGLGMSLWLF